MTRTYSVALGIFALTLALLLVGCNKRRSDTSPADSARDSGGTQVGTSSTPREAVRSAGMRGTRERAKLENYLHQLGLAYQTSAAGGNPPKSLEDLGPNALPKELADWIKEGYIVVYWGVDPSKLPQGTSDTVLAYEKELAAGSRYVLMADVSAKTLTTAQCEKAPKAGSS